MKQKMKSMAVPLIVILVSCVPFFMGAFDKDKPAASTSLRSSNPELLANQSAIQAAFNNEHIFSGTAAGTQTGDQTQGSARCFSQSSAPATRIDGDGFLSTDLGSLWVDTDDNAVYVLTVVTPTWTPVSTEVIATLLASGRIFGSTLGVTGNFAVNTNKFTVTAASGNTLVAGTLDVTGNIDPTSYENTNGGFLDEDDMASDSATAVASQQSVAAFAKANGHPDINGTPTAVFTKYFTGTLDSDTQTNVTHSIAGGVTKILSVSCSAFNDNTNIFVVGDIFTGASATQAVKYAWDATFVYFIDVGTLLQGNAFRVKVDYIL